MLPLYEDAGFTFHFADDRIIPRFHLEGVEARRQVEVYKIDPGTGERLGLLATGTVGEGGWVDLPDPIIVRAGDAFVAVPKLGMTWEAGMVLVETERLLVRQWVPDDWKRFQPLGTDPRMLEFLNTEPWSDERIRRFIDKGIEVAKTRGWILWPVIHREDAVLIGFCGFSDEFPPDVEIGWRFLPEYWGKGLATEAARAVMQYGFDTFGFGRLVCVPQAANRRSIRVAEKLGMVFERSFVHKGKEVVCYVKASPSTQGPEAGA